MAKKNGKANGVPNTLEEALLQGYGFLYTGELDGVVDLKLQGGLGGFQEIELTLPLAKTTEINESGVAFYVTGRAKLAFGKPRVRA